MATKRHDDGRLCSCGRTDGTCAGLAVRRLGRDRVQELAEEIWAASSGDLLPGRPPSDPRSSRAGASAQAAFLRRRAQDREAWRLDWGWWGLAVLGAAIAGAFLVGEIVADWLSGPAALLLAGWTGWRLRMRNSPEAASWRRQAAAQRRTARLLAPLADEGWLVLHDLTLPGWLGSLEHLLVGPTGVWVIQSWQRQRKPAGGAVPAGILRELQSQAQALAELLEGWAQLPIQPLLCGRRARLRTRATHSDIQVTTPRQLTQVVRSGSPVAPAQVEQATDRLLEVLRPAA